MFRDKDFKKILPVEYEIEKMVPNTLILSKDGTYSAILQKPDNTKN